MNASDTAKDLRSGAQQEVVCIRKKYLGAGVV